MARHAARTGKKVGGRAVGGVPISERILTAAGLAVLGVFLAVTGASSLPYLFHGVLVALAVVCFVGVWDVLKRH